MNQRRIRLIATIAGALMLAAPAGAGGDSAVPFYNYESFVDIALPDPLDEPMWSEIQGMNDTAVIVGFNRYNTLDYPWMIDEGEVHQLELSTSYGRAVAVNNENVAVGWTWLTVNPNGMPQARRWVNPLEEGEPLAGLGAISQAWDVSHDGVIVGWSDDNLDGSGKTAFRWEAGEALLLGTLGGKTSEALAMNAIGQITGGVQLADGSTHVFLWDAGVMADLGDFSQAGGAGGIGRDVSDDGVIVGVMFTASGERAFRWHNGVVEDLGTLDTDDRSEALAVNQAGDIVGRSWHSSNPQSSMRAFVWREGVMYDMATQVLNVDTLSIGLQSAHEINASGQIAGIVSYPSHSAFIVTPTPPDFEYSVTHLVPPPGAWNVIPKGINEFGEAVGWLYDGELEPEYRAWKWTPDTGMVVLPPNGIGNYAAVDLNDEGVVAGGDVVVFGDGAAWKFGNDQYAFVGLLPGTTWSLPSGINAAGDVVGYGDDYTPESNSTRFFIHTSSTGLLEIPDGPGIITGIGKINDLQVVAGRSGSEAFRWTLESGMELIPYPGDGDSFGYGINNKNQVSGIVAIGLEKYGALYTDGVGWQLIVNILPPGIPGEAPAWEYGLAVNSNSEVVGFSEYDNDHEGYEIGWVWSPQKDVRILDEVIDPTGLPASFHVFRAVDINDAGQILAEGSGLGGLLHGAYMLTPVAKKEPPASDLDGDGEVGPADLAALLTAWGPCPKLNCPADIDADGLVGPADLANLLSEWTS